MFNKLSNDEIIASVKNKTIIGLKCCRTRTNKAPMLC